MQKINKFFLILLIFILVNDLLPAAICMIHAFQRYIVFPKELFATKDGVEIAMKISLLKLFIKNLLYFVLSFVLTIIFKKEGLYYLLLVVTLREALLFFKNPLLTILTSLNYWNTLFCRLTATFSGGMLSLLLKEGKTTVKQRDLQ